MPFALPPKMTTNTIALCVEKSWRLEVRCAEGHKGGWTAAELGEAFKPEVTLGAIAERLKCSTCGALDGRLLLLQDHAATRAKARRERGINQER